MTKQASTPQSEALTPFRIRTRWIIAGLLLFVLAFDSWEAHAARWRLPMGFAYMIIFVHLLMDILRRFPDDPSNPGTLDPVLWERKLRPWSLACVCFATVMMLNFWVCRWVLPIQVQEILVEREMCWLNSGSRVLVHNGHGCFSTWGWIDHGWYKSKADLWDVDVDLIEGDVPAGGKATLTLQSLENSWLNWGNYIHIMSVR